MRRRDFIEAIAGAAAGWPLIARAQQTPMPVIGWLSSGSRDADDALRLPPFRLGLNEMGYVEGRNVAIEYRQVADQVERLPAFASDLDRKSTRLNSSHLGISYAVFCLKKKKQQR